MGGVHYVILPVGGSAANGHTGDLRQPVHSPWLSYCICPQYYDQLYAGCTQTTLHKKNTLL